MRCPTMSSCAAIGFGSDGDDGRPYLRQSSGKKSYRVVDVDQRSSPKVVHGCCRDAFLERYRHRCSAKLGVEFFVSAVRWFVKCVLVVLAWSGPLFRLLAHLAQRLSALSPKHSHPPSVGPQQNHGFREM